MSISSTQDFYKQSISIACGAGAGKIYVTIKPTVASGYVVISPLNSSLREIIRYSATGTDGSGDYVDVTNISDRGLGGTTAQAHGIGESVRMNITAEHWDEMLAEFAGKVDTSVISTDATLGGLTPSDALLSTQKAISLFVNGLISTLSNAVSSALSGKVNKTGNETISDVKAFSSSPLVPDATAGQQAVSFAQFVSAVISGGVKATTALFGISRLSTPPVDPNDPVVVGGNDPRLPSADPTTLFKGINSSSFVTQVFTAICGTFTVTIASPAVFTCANHGLVSGNKIRFTTTGSLPTGLAINTTYYVIATGLTASTYQVSLTLNGSAVNTSGTQSGVHTCREVWERPSNATLVNPIVIGSGGNGGNSTNIGGGGGGAKNTEKFIATAIASVVTVVVAIPGSTPSSFGSYLSAFNGGTPSSANCGGGGGGVGGNGDGAGNGGLPQNVTTTNANGIGGSGANGTKSGTTAPGGSAEWGGGGGGNFIATPERGGSSIHGAGGGGSFGNGSAGGIGGTIGTMTPGGGTGASRSGTGFCGDGGNGVASGAGNPGGIPGGGGGGGGTTGGLGGRGEVIVTTYF